MSSLVVPDDVVRASFATYNALPAHGKPLKRANGVPEWTIMATICVVVPGGKDSPKGGPTLDESSPTPPRIIPVALGTGVKVAPYTKLSERGDSLHDSHAEILARRGYLRWLIHQGCLLALAESNEAATSHGAEIYVERKPDGKFGLRDGVQTWLYVSMLPCGDASTVYTAAHQPESEALQWAEADAASSADGAVHAVGQTESSSSALPGVARGRSGYTAISALRTKPGRPDSIPSISMSCSDKIASWSVVGLQGALLSRVFQPIYIDAVVVGGVDPPPSWESRTEAWYDQIKREVERALWGRLEGIEGDLTPPYTLHRPTIHLTRLPFPHAKPQVNSRSRSSSTASPDPDPAPSPLSLSHLPWLASKPGKPLKAEILTDGTLLGFPRKAGVLMRDKGRSRVCKLEIMNAFLRLLELHGGPVDPQRSTSYHALKHSSHSEYQTAKAFLRGQIGPCPSPPAGLHQFEGILHTAVPPPLSHTMSPPISPPFAGWLVSGHKFESFNRTGQVNKDE
ncbi:hypothetical protein IAU60_006676 [Kwoniella sp. DSM 27419]